MIHVQPESQFKTLHFTSKIKRSNDESVVAEEEEEDKGTVTLRGHSALALCMDLAFYLKNKQTKKRQELLCTLRLA